MKSAEEQWSEVYTSSLNEPGSTKIGGGGEGKVRRTPVSYAAFALKKILKNQLQRKYQPENILCGAMPASVRIITRFVFPLGILANLRRMRLPLNVW